MNTKIKTQLQKVIENGNEGAIMIRDLREDTSSQFTQRLIKEGWNFGLLAMDIDCIEYYLESGDLDGEDYGQEQSIEMAIKSAERYVDSLEGYIIVK